MLPDPLKVCGLDLYTSDGLDTITVMGDVNSFAITDVSPGRTVRRCAEFSETGMPATLTISHAESKENKPTVTDRSLVRLDLAVKGPAGEELKEYMSIQFTRPRTAKQANGTTNVNHQNVFFTLLGFLAGLTDADGFVHKEQHERFLALEP